jgi:hypothetical protein
MHRSSISLFLIKIVYNWIPGTYQELFCSRAMGARQKQILKEEIENAPSQYYKLSMMQFLEFDHPWFY